MNENTYPMTDREVKKFERFLEKMQTMSDEQIKNLLLIAQALAKQD